MGGSDPYLFVGLRGVLALDPGLRTRWDAGTLEEDAFSLIAKRSAMLGFSDLSGDPLAHRQWGHADAGGTWRQDGAEHLLGWLQMNVRGEPAAPVSTVGRRPLPIQAALAVIEQALARVGSVELTEVDALVPLSAMADPLANLATERDWAAFGTGGQERHTVVMLIDTVPAGGRRLDSARIDDIVVDLGKDVLDRAGADAPGLAEATEALAGRQFVNQSFSRGRVELAYTAERWTVELAGWIVGLAAYACRSCRVDASMLVAIRPASLSRPPAAPVRVRA